MATEIKPCPFCGREELKFNGEYHANYRSHVIECHCSVKMHGYDSIQLKKQWNTRTDQQNEALMAQVEELYDGLGTLADQLVEEIQRRQEKTGRRQLGKEGALRRVNRLLAIFNSDMDKPLDSLKARIEQETIDRCVVMAKMTSVVEQSGNDMKRQRPIKTGEAIMAKLKCMPRKYQPSTKENSNA